jgi:sodium-dependent dicarboxylate transporter 2/3/5
MNTVTTTDASVPGQPSRTVRAAAALLGIGVFAWLAFGPPSATADPRAARAGAMVALMAILWIGEVLPIHWTACLPLVIAPMFGLFGAQGWTGNFVAALKPYFDPYIFLFAGGMAIAAAMQQWNLHRRVALGVMAGVGTRPPRLLLGFLCATAFVSMWISNTATAAMMLPIGLAVMAQLEEAEGGRRLRHYGMAIMLAIAYGSNIGGIGTKIGTAPNAQFSGFMERLGSEISFLQFLLVGLPFVAMFLPVAWWALWRVGKRERLTGDLGKEVIAAERTKLGPWRRAEVVVIVVFTLAAALWIFGKPLAEVARGWNPRWGSSHVEGAVAVCAALLLMLLRAHGRPVLAPRSLATVPWETLLLLGGGFAMAAAVQASGLSTRLASVLTGLRDMPPIAQLLVASLATVAISAIASNTSTIAVMLVVLKDVVDPSMRDAVLFAATLASSCDFALPAGTPPNAIVFGSGYVSIPRMARLGIGLDLAAALLVALWCRIAVPWVLGG